MGHRVLVVLDPHFSRDSALEASTLADWVTYDYPVKMAASLLSSQALRGSVFPGETDRIIRKRPGFVPVLLHEKLLVWLRIQQRGIVVDFMQFQKFRDLMLAPNPNFTWEFKHYHAIWGGLDLTVDPRQVVNISQAYNLLNVLSSEKGCGLESSSQLHRYIERLQMLESILPVWPPSQEMLFASKKFNVIKTLDEIAGNTTNSPRPQTEILSHTNRSQSFEGFVLKREGSDCTRHIFLPGTIDSSNLPRDKKGFRWLKQSYVPALRHVGEWRVIVLDCRPLWVIHTSPGNHENQMVFCHRDAGLSLEKMSSRLQKPYGFDDIMDPVGGTVAERHLADEELESFVVATLSSLIAIEEGILQGTSSLRLMARVDLGVLRGSDGRLGYFVNEVERGIMITLFSQGNPRWALRLADEFSSIFSQWIDDTSRNMQRTVEPSNRRKHGRSIFSLDRS
ncbi:hypothetical protein BDR06DRAFT_1012566 [Suillus hirtellus]|nr:hypothetical protein BDR06DRAFT_1012566 [Suillus hirtellus]